MTKKKKKRASTLSALLEDKPKRGRPSHAVSRQNVYVALTKAQKENMNRLTAYLPQGLVRADLPDLAVSILSIRLESLRRALADRNREIPEGVTDLESLYLLWDLSLPATEEESKWTSIRVSPQQAIELGRTQGTLGAVFGANRSDTFGLGLALLAQFLEREALQGSSLSLAHLRQRMADIYL